MKNERYVLTRDDVFDICEALNSRARHFNELVSGHPTQDKQARRVWRDAAEGYLQLTRKLLRQHDLNN